MSHKEIILVNLPPGNNHRYDNPGCVYPATGIMVIGTILKKKGYPVVLIDGALEPNYEEIVLNRLSEDTAFVGFSTMTSQIVMAYELAKKIKEKKLDLPVIIGGIHPTLFPEQTANNTYVDIAVINEGTKTVLDIIDYLEGKIDLATIKGIAFCGTAGKVRINPPQLFDDISEIPHFDFELLDIARYLNAKSVYDRELNPSGNRQIKLMPILTGLGCCFKCAFCINVILKRQYRTRSAESIVEEIQRLQSLYQVNAFLFLDEDFCINKKRLAEFIELVKKKNIKFYGRIWSRVSYFKQDSFKKIIPEMEKIGIRSIAMGAESGSQRILDYLCKEIKVEDIACAAKELYKTEITPRFSFIAGLDGEKKSETLATYKLCAKLLKLNPRTDIAGPFIFRYYPGSPIFNQMVEKYKINLPQSIETWKGALNDDGSIIVDTQQWTWRGFLKYSESMHNYIALYVQVLNKPAYRDKLPIRFLKKILLWRLANGEYGYIMEYYFFRFFKKSKKFLSTINIFGTKGSIK